MPLLQQKESWHSFGLSELAKRFAVDFGVGFAEEEAAEREKRYGPNRITAPESYSLAKVIGHQFTSPLVIVLVVAGVISLVLREYPDAIVILITLIINTVVGALQEGKASQAFLRLQEHIQKRAVVVRGGTEHEVESAHIVPGDILVLRTGNSVAADARILEAHNFRTNESALTGEWVAVDKQPSILSEKTRLTERTNMVWAGTLVEDGWARALVVNTGDTTEFGAISRLVGETRKVKTPLQKSMVTLGRIIAVFVLLVVIAIFALGVARGEPFETMFVTSVAIAVAAVPEGLPVAVTVILALGMERILRKGGLVKKLTAAETLGSTNIILTDKTGTLTQAKMQVSAVVTSAHLFGEGDGKLTQEAHASAALSIGISTSDAFIENPEAELSEWKVRGSPTDSALLLAGIHAGLKPQEILQQLPRVDFLPFEPERRFAASLHRLVKKSTLLRLSGAPEVILASSVEAYVGSDHTVKLTDERRRMLEKAYEDLTAQGARVLAVAFKKSVLEKIPLTGEDGFFKDLTFVGFISFQDPLRPDVPDAIAHAMAAGLRPVIVTGDHKLTAGKIAQEIGIDMERWLILEGADVENMSADDLRERVTRVGVYARVLPHQKLRIVEAWQQRGAVVAMTGDGVNDAPALKRADVGMALGSGTEVAKEAADIVLLDNSFSVMVAAIEQGRVILDNLRKVVTFVFATGFTEIILVGGALVAGLPLPVLATQILWTNIVGGGLLNFAFAFEPMEDDVMKHRPPKRAKIFTREMWFLIFIIGLATDFLLFALFLFLYHGGYPLEMIRTLMFIGLALDSIFFAYSLRSLRRPLWRINPVSNPFFLAGMATSMILLVVAFFFTPLANLLSLAPIGMKEVGIILMLGVINIIAIEFGKWLFIRRHHTE